MWTDSTVALGYIRNQTSRFKPFVANRLATIHELTALEEWRYVPSKENPADLASRGIAADDHDAISRWLTGPEFLQQREHHWPTDPINTSYGKLPSLTDDAEVKATVLSTQTADNDVMLIIARHYSSWDRAVRAVAWLSRCCALLLIICIAL